jgi:hypothetical protein
MIVAEGKIRKVRDEIQEHPSQYIVRCRDRNASGVAALLFAEEHITEIKLNDDRLGMLVMTATGSSSRVRSDGLRSTATGSRAWCRPTRTWTRCTST